MTRTVAAQLDARHRLLPEKATGMAKAAPDSLRKAENWRDLGAVVAAVRTESKLSLKQFADAMGRDERQVARWETGDERPQIETVFVVEQFRESMVIALAKLTPALEVETIIRRRA